jgi:transposase-like protein
MGRGSRYSPEVRERAVRMLVEHQAEHESQWAAIGSIAGKIGCSAERPTYRQPFDLLTVAAREDQERLLAGVPAQRRFENWLPE